MALTLVKETGVGASDANSYASLADGDSYHEGHLYASAWTGATTGQKEAALVMATRLIDGAYQFGGFKANLSQALQWPRQRCIDPDLGQDRFTVLQNNRGPYFDDDSIPQALVNAVCETARELIKADTTDAVDGEGLSRVSIAGAIDLRFDKKDKQPAIPVTAQLFLAKLGSYRAGQSSVAKLVRV